MKKSLKKSLSRTPRNINKNVLSALAAVLLLASCGGGSSNGDGGTDNSQNDWRTSNSIGYAGGNVVFGSQKIVGEWSAIRTLTVNGTKNSFVSTSNYMVLGIKFDSIRYHEYWAEFGVSGGKVTSNGAWTPLGGYGVSQDGKILTIEHSPKHTYNYKSSEAGCLLVTEMETRDEYRLCKVT